MNPTPAATTGDVDAGGGRIITFYSYKGGCGRTMALANVAWILASNGYRVLAVDWDLESPGLHRYFHPFLLDKELRDTAGLIELIQGYAERTVSEDAAENWFEDATRIDRATLSLRWNFPHGGALDFMPPGRQDQHYSPKVSTFDWQNLWSRLNGRAFIAALAAAMRRDYDYVLVDSRTGLSDSAGVCTVILPDVVVDCFAMSTQGVSGAVAVARSIVNAKPGTLIYPLPGRVEPGEHAKLQEGRAYAQRQFRTYVEKLGVDLDEYWRGVEVPYRPYYAYEEILAVFGDRPRQANSPLAAFLTLAEALTGSRLEFPEIADKQRLSVLGVFERSADVAPLRIVIDHAPIDRVWAEWISQELTRVGHECSLAPRDAAQLSAIGVDRAIVLLSRTGYSYEDVLRRWQREFDRTDTQPADFLGFVRVNGPRLPVGVSAGSVDFGTLRPEDALGALFRSLGLRVDASGTEPAATGQIRFPALLAPHWRVTPLRNPTFTGRDGIIDSLRNQLLDARPGSGVVALYGISGVGKTQLALEYVYRFAASYDIVWWISADSYDQARTGFEQLADVLDLPPSRDESGRIEAIKDALRRRDSPFRWLIVFDNADDPVALANLFADGAGDIVVTTRNPLWSRTTRALEIGVFQRAESIRLLDHSGANLTGEDAAVLAERLGDLPVALETAGHWLATTARPLADYLRILDERTTEVLSYDPVPGYSTFTATCAVAMESLQAQSPAAARLMELLAFLAPRPIPTAILNTEPIRNLLTEYEPTLRDPLLLGRLTQNIGRFGLARSDPASRSIIVHILIQQIIRESLAEDVREKSRHEVHEALAAANPGDPEDAAKWPLYESLRPHIDAAEAHTSTSETVQQLIVDVVRYLRLRGYYSSSQELARRALTAWQAADPDPDRVMTLLLRFQLANTVWFAGDWRQALEIDEDVLERLTRTLGEDHPYTLMVAGSYGRDLRDRGDWKAARVREERTYALMREVLGDEHPRTIIAAMNLALSSRLDGDYRAASALHIQVLNTRRRLLGREHPATLSAALAYGSDLRNDGDLQGSRQILEDALELAGSVLGDEHPVTLMTIRSLATTLRWLGEPQRADHILSGAVLSYDKVLGAHHPETVGCQLERACVTSDLGDDETAMRIAGEADKAYRVIYGDDHPTCLVARNDYAVFVRRSGDLDTGRRLAEQNAARMAEILGPGHPSTALAQVNVANGAYHAGEFDYATRTDDKAYRVLKAALQPEHPALVAMTLNAALGRIAVGMPGAEKAYTDALRYAQRILGEDHPITLGGQERRRLDLDIEPFVM